MSAPAADLTIVEAGSFVAVPTAGRTLAQLGAEVIRIDPLRGGNDLHRWPLSPRGTSYYWASLNAGKRSVAIDLRSEEGRELAVGLMTAAGSGRGIVIDNVVGRRWMSPQRLCERRPDLIHLRLQGHPDGRPAVDYTVNAEAGVPTITGPEGWAAPVNQVLPAWDIAAGMTIATGVLAAARARDRTGEGSLIELALADVALAGVANLGWLSEASDRGRERPRHGNHVYGSFGVDVECRDGTRLMVVALTPGQWTALQQATGTVEVFAALSSALGAELDDEVQRYRLRETIAGILRPWFADRDAEQAGKELDVAKVLWGRYRSMPEVVAAHRGGAHPVLGELDLDGGEQLISARSPLRIDGDHGPLGRPTVLGRDTAEVLSDALHLTRAEISGLQRRGVIDPPDRTNH